MNGFFLTTGVSAVKRALFSLLVAAFAVLVLYVVTLNSSA
jgi:hypothetical protein